MALVSTPWSPSSGALLIFVLLLLISLGFLVRFVWPALERIRALGSGVRELEQLQTPSAPVDPDALARGPMQAPIFARLWHEYAQTLYRVTTDGANGKAQVRWRTTNSAAYFFTEAALVDIPLKTEFYKHLPGILTGIGILGTFAGLIAGLAQFQINSDPETVRLSLNTLIQGVGHAFQVSALAIALAMLFIWIEKSLVTLACRRVARLVYLIDSFFEGGVETEYLARLVHAQELSCQQLAALRQELGKGAGSQLAEQLDALVSHMSIKLAEQHKQIADQIGNAVSLAMTKHLAPPLLQIQQTLQKIEERETREQEYSSTAVPAQAGLSPALEQALGRTHESIQAVMAQLQQLTRQLETQGQENTHHTPSAPSYPLGHTAEEMGEAARFFSETSAELVRAAQALKLAAQEASHVMREQVQTRDAFAHMLESLKPIVQHVRREAVLTEGLVSGMERAASTLAQAEGEAGRYLEGINQVLVEAHRAFADNIEQTLRQGNTQFHRELSTAVDYLRGVIEELGDTLEVMPSKK